MRNFHFCGQQQTLGSFVLSDVSYRKVWQEEQNKSKENSFTQQRTELFSKYNIWKYVGFLLCQGKPDIMIFMKNYLYRKLTFSNL